MASPLDGSHDWQADFESAGEKAVHRTKDRECYKYTCRKCGSVRFVPVDDGLPPPPGGCPSRP